MVLEVELIELKVRVPWEMAGVMLMLELERSTPYLLLSNVSRLMWVVGRAAEAGLRRVTTGLDTLGLFYRV